MVPLGAAQIPTFAKGYLYLYFLAVFLLFVCFFQFSCVFNIQLRWYYVGIIWVSIYILPSLTFEV